MRFQYQVIRPVVKLAAMLSFCILIFALQSCTEESSDTCFSFDERQCLSDPWRALPDFPDPSGAPLTATSGDCLKAYFVSNDIELKSITIDEAFHEVTCLACDVCPTSTRIYISVSQSDKEKVEILDLLSLTEIDCEGI